MLPPESTNVAELHELIGQCRIDIAKAAAVLDVAAKSYRRALDHLAIAEAELATQRYRLYETPPLPNKPGSRQKSTGSRPG